MTKKEFEIHIKSELEGEIRAYKHIMNICKLCLRESKKMSAQKNIKKLIAMNKHLWK